MESWQLDQLKVGPDLPEVLSSSKEGRVIVAALPAGRTLGEHCVHERAWVFVVAGEVEVTTPAGETVRGGPGLLLEFSPLERHSLRALEDCRLAIVLAPWPGVGHPGAMTLRDKVYAHRHARQRR